MFVKNRGKKRTERLRNFYAGLMGLWKISAGFGGRDDLQHRRSKADYPRWDRPSIVVNSPYRKFAPFVRLIVP
jgi:hypothetical protein